MAKTAQNTLTDDLMSACEKLEERYGRRKIHKVTDFIEALMTQILELGAPEKASREAMARLRGEYVDWNDMRVATIREVEDNLGTKYPKVRERAEDIKHLLADLYTAFRRMDINDLLTPEGIETLRALPDTTNVRRDMVERALVLVLDLKTFPCDEEQFRLLKFLGGVPKQAALAVYQKKIEDSLDTEQILRLSRVLREHVHVYTSAGEEEPQPVNYGQKATGKVTKGDKADKGDADKEPKEPKTTKRVAKK